MILQFYFQQFCVWFELVIEKLVILNVSYLLFCLYKLIIWNYQGGDEDDTDAQTIMLLGVFLERPVYIVRCVVVRVRDGSSRLQPFCSSPNDLSGYLVTWYYAWCQSQSQCSLQQQLQSHVGSNGCSAVQGAASNHNVNFFHIASRWCIFFNSLMLPFARIFDCQVQTIEQISRVSCYVWVCITGLVMPYL